MRGKHERAAFLPLGDSRAPLISFGVRSLEKKKPPEPFGSGGLCFSYGCGQLALPVDGAVGVESPR
jgi:hypothetical protein